MFLPLCIPTTSCHLQKSPRRRPGLDFRLHSGRIGGFSDQNYISQRLCCSKLLLPRTGLLVFCVPLTTTLPGACWPGSCSWRTRSICESLRVGGLAVLFDAEKRFMSSSAASALRGLGRPVVRPWTAFPSVLCSPVLRAAEFQLSSEWQDYSFRGLSCCGVFGVQCNLVILDQTGTRKD